jgi:hypothetical protein
MQFPMLVAPKKSQKPPMRRADVSASGEHVESDGRNRNYGDRRRNALELI